MQIRFAYLGLARSLRILGDNSKLMVASLHVDYPFGLSYIAGVYYDEVPPVPIPNTEVKLIRADNTWRAAAREDRSMPALTIL